MLISLIVAFVEETASSMRPVATTCASCPPHCTSTNTNTPPSLKQEGREGKEEFPKPL